MESFYGSAPNVSLTKSPVSRPDPSMMPVVFPEARCHPSIDRPLHTKKECGYFIFQQYPYLCRAALILFFQQYPSLCRVALILFFQQYPSLCRAAMILFFQHYPSWRRAALILFFQQYPSLCRAALILFFQQYPSLCRAAMIHLKRSLKKINGLGGAIVESVSGAVL